MVAGHVQHRVAAVGLAQQLDQGGDAGQRRLDLRLGPALVQLGLDGHQLAPRLGAVRVAVRLGCALVVELVQLGVLGGDHVGHRAGGEVVTQLADAADPAARAAARVERGVPGVQFGVGVVVVLVPLGAQFVDAREAVQIRQVRPATCLILRH